MASASSATAVRARVSARIGGIAESATLKVDAKAKALKAEGRPVIGFGAGERVGACAARPVDWPPGSYRGPASACPVTCRRRSRGLAEPLGAWLNW